MKNINTYIQYFFLALFIVSCNNVLDTEDQTAIEGEGLFRDKDLAELYLNTFYQSILPAFGMLHNAGMSDDAIGGSAYGKPSDDALAPVAPYMTGTVLDPTAGSPNTIGNYSSTAYAVVRNIVIFLEGIEDGSLAEEDKEELMGQAYFLRAYLYWDLVLMYGGVPIVDRILDVNDGIEANSLPRSSATECVEFIVGDLDKAIAMLDGVTLQHGRATAAAAAALKGRVLLFFASPQFDPDGLTNADGIASRWQAAYNANLEAKNIAEASGHGLYADYANIFLKEDNEEAILFVKYTVGLRPHGFETSVRPTSVTNSSSISGAPTWDFVKAFPMKDGVSIDESADYDSLKYWENRDPRFYTTVGYNGTAWSFEGRSTNYQWTYQANALEGGSIPNTGFYLRKNVDTERTNVESAQSGTDWIEIRFAEVLLNLAESANEIGNTQEAIDLLSQIRERAGIESANNYGITASTKVELRKLIMNERRIELSFENKRHFDLRRRNMFVNDLEGSSGNGLNGARRSGILTKLDTAYIYTEVDPSIEAEYSVNSNGDSTLVRTRGEVAFDLFETNMIDTIDWGDADKLEAYFNYEFEYVDNESGEINFLQPKYNFYYLPTNATVRNEKLEQTINWLEGSFDPLID